MRMQVLVALSVLLLGCPAGGVGSGGTGCDPEAVAARCEGAVEVRCQRNPGNPSSVVRTDCAERKMQCHAEGDFVGCVHEPTRCDPATYQGTCFPDGSATVCRGSGYPEVLWPSELEAQAVCASSATP
jgi:hypothetical protein